MKENKTIWIFAGEESGDIYGSMLAKELYQKNQNLTIKGMGGYNMKDAGVDIIVDSTELGVVGLLEVLKHIKTFYKIFHKLVNKAVEERPDAIILIDYPGFNLRFAKQMYKHNIPIIWYISPQVWAWGKKRIPLLAKYCKKMFVIFPFETAVYAETNLDVEFLGHPLIEVIEQRTNSEIPKDLNRVLLLPGSRFHEIDNLLIPMLKSVEILSQKHPSLSFSISAPRQKIHTEIVTRLNKYAEKHPDLPLIDVSYGNTGELMQKVGTAIAASGTVTVECGIAGLPLVVIYKINPITYFVAKLLVKIKYFTVFNLIADKEIFKEFMQEHVRPKDIVTALEDILPGGKRRDIVEQDIAAVKSILAGEYNKPTAQIAKKCLEIIGVN